MLRSILSVVAGTASWTVLWLTTNVALQAALPGSYRPDGSVESAGLLGFILAGSVVFSIVAGYVTAALAARGEMKHALALGILQLAIGIPVQIAAWNLLPIWYHLSFLVLLLPGNLAGGALRLSRKLRPASA